MTPNDEAFYELCRALRALGCLSVESEGRKATFTTTLPRHLTEPRVNPAHVDDLERFPKK